MRNHGFSIAACVFTDKDVDELTWPDFRDALLRRIAYLDRDENVGTACDACNVWETPLRDSQGHNTP